MKRPFVICEPWHVVVVPFPFSETAGSKPSWHGDTWIEDRQTVGLDRRCFVRMKLFTLDSRLVSRRIGRLAESDPQRVRENLARCLTA